MPQPVAEAGDVQAPTRQEIESALIARFRYADAHRQKWDEKAVEWYKLYVGYRDDEDDVDPETGLSRSNLHIPRTYEEIDTLRARIVKSFFSSRPYVDFLPMPPDPDTPQLLAANDEKAKIAASVVDEQLEANQIARRFYDFVTSFLVFPAGIMSVGWRYETRRVRRRVPQVLQVLGPMGFMPATQPVTMPDGTVQLMPVTVMQTVEEETVVWDDNDIQNVDFFDFWPDPRGYDLDSCRFVFHREWLRRSEIEDILAVLEEAGGGQVYPVDWDAIRQAGSSLEEGRWRRMSAVGMAPETQDSYWTDPEGQDDKSAMYEVLHYWEDDRHGILINRCHLAYWGQNPYWRHGKKPFAVGVFEPLPNEFYGLSAVQILEGLQHELNTLRNQRVDNVAFVLNRMWKVRRGADIDEAELVSRPAGIIHVDTDTDVTPLDIPDVTRSAYQDEQVVKDDMQNAVGVPDIVRGAVAERGQTATEVVTKSTSASIRFDVKIMLYETMGVKRLVHLMDCNNQQFIDAPRLVRMFGDSGSAPEWKRVEPGHLIGEFDYRPAGANVDPAANKETRRQQLTQVMQVVLQTKNPFVNPYELTKAWLESFDLRNVEKLLVSPQELAQRQMLQQAMMQQLQQQGGPGGPGGLPNGIPGGPMAPPMPQAPPTPEIPGGNSA